MKGFVPWARKVLPPKNRSAQLTLPPLFCHQHLPELCKREGQSAPDLIQLNTFTAAEGTGCDRRGTSIFIKDQNFSTSYLFWGTGPTQCSTEALPHQQDVHPTYPKYSSYMFILQWQTFIWSKPPGKAHPRLLSALAAPKSESLSWLLLGYVPQYAVIFAGCNAVSPCSWWTSAGWESQHVQSELEHLDGMQDKTLLIFAVSTPNHARSPRLSVVLAAKSRQHLGKKNIYKNHSPCSCPKILQIQASNMHFC